MTPSAPTAALVFGTIGECFGQTAAPHGGQFVKKRIGVGGVSDPDHQPAALVASDDKSASL
jgi:hypothetical protein